MADSVLRLPEKRIFNLSCFRINESFSTLARKIKIALLYDIL
jgi:hypothetical protein